MSSSKSKTKVAGLHDWQKSFNESPLNWQVEKRPLFDKSGIELPIRGTFRFDNNMFLGAVKERYHIIQNENLFDIAGDIEKNNVPLDLMKSGTIQGGIGVFAQFKLPFKIDIGGFGDIYSSSLLMRTFHNGCGAVSFAVQTLRLICTNGMKANKSYHLFNIFHTIGAEERIKRARNVINVIQDDLNSFKALMETFSSVKLNTKQIGMVVHNTLQDKDGKLSNIALGRASIILGKFEHNDNNEFTKQQNTAYALFQSFTNFADHNLSSRKSEGETEEQAKSRGVLFGAGESLKFAALSEIVKCIKQDFVTVKIPQNSLIA